MNDVLLGQGDAVATTEAHLVGALLAEPPDGMTREDLYFLASEIVRPEQFYEPVLGDLFAIMGDLAEKGADIMSSNLVLRFEQDPRLEAVGARSYLNDLVGLGEAPFNRPGQVKHMAELVALQHGLREIDVTMREARERLAAAPTEQTIRDELGGLIRQLVAIDESTGAKRVTLAEAGLKRMDRLVKNPDKADSTGLASLDEAMVGGLWPGRAYGVAARKKTGKSALGGTISGNLDAAGVKHAVFLFEMGPDMYADRDAARGLGVNTKEFLSPDPDADLVTRGAGWFGAHGHNTILIDCPGWTLDNVLRELHALKKKGIRGFILDYIQRLQGRPPRMNQAEFQEMAANELALACGSLGLWGLVFAQQNQEGNVRGGEGMRLAFDQMYFMAQTNNGDGVWLAMGDTRYTETIDIGSKFDAGLIMDPAGPHFVEPPRESEPREDEDALL